jgi:hypothetical protein
VADEEELGGGDGPLWAVDFVVPDDPRELAADIEAYRREARARHRHERMQRLLQGTGKRRPGLSLPLIAAIMAIAGLLGGLVAVLPPTRPIGPQPLPLAAHPSQPTGHVDGLAPDVVLQTPSGPQTLRSLRPVLVALIPDPCRCLTTLDDLAGQAQEKGLALEVVAPNGRDGQLTTLVDAIQDGQPYQAEDTHGVLARTFHARGVTALLVAPDGTVRFVVPHIRPGERIEGWLDAGLTGGLGAPTPAAPDGASASPGGSGATSLAPAPGSR